MNKVEIDTAMERTDTMYRLAVLALLQKGYKVSAIRMLRSHVVPGLGLTDAKRYVEQITLAKEL